MRNFLEVSSVCGRAAKKSGWPAVAATPNVAIAVVKKLRRSDTVISHLQGFSTEISDLDLSLVHRVLLLPWTQRICHQRGSRSPTPEKRGLSECGRHQQIPVSEKQLTGLRPHRDGGKRLCGSLKHEKFSGHFLRS